MDMDTIRRDLSNEPAEIFIQMGNNVCFYGVGTSPAILVIRDGGESLKATNRSALSIPVQGDLQVFIRNGLADAGTEIPVIHRLSRTSVM
jgi:hypothetical protein